MKTLVALTGANGAFGSEILAHLLNDSDLKIRILLIEVDKLKPLVKSMIKNNPDRIEVLYGNTNSETDCQKLIQGARYVVHASGMIPPKTEHNEKGAYGANYLGTKNIVDAIRTSPDRDNIYFVNIGSVAEYGNRNEKHLWARVGDPLISSDYDNYSYTKILAERYVLEAGLPHFVSLRQTAIAHRYLFNNNLSDGLLYQAPLNAPYEWVTDGDSGLLIEHLVEYDLNHQLDTGFWNRIYNIGGGKANRLTGYETMNRGFSLLGRNLKVFMDPNWFATRNFHGAFFYDSEVLNSYLHYQTETVDDYWKNMSKIYWYFHLGKLVPPSWLKKTLFTKLTKYDDAPKYWVDNHIDGKVKAYYGGYTAYESIPKSWDYYPLLCENKDSTGSFIDYDKLKDEAYAKPYLLEHGFDDTKPLDQLDIKDMKQAAKFRGGFCLSDDMVKGDMFTKLTWQCHKGHTFKATPYSILFGGFWCPECFNKPWKNGRMAKYSPYFAQLYYADHSKDEEDDIYPPKEKQ